MLRFLAVAVVFMATPAVAQVPTVQLKLAGTTSTNVAVADEAAFVRFLPNAQTGFDPNDASKLFPFASTYALLAPVGERDGVPYQLSVNSLPDGSPGVLMTAVSVPVDFFATNQGSYTIRWTGPSALPAGWDVYLRDYVTGTVTNLRQQTVYAFTAPATGGQWSSRFQLVFAPAGVTAQVDVADTAGWRLLSAPVSGVTPTTLAGLNLVQGVPAGTPAAQFPAQYPLAAFGTAPTTNVTRAFARSSDGYLIAGNPFAASFAISGLSATGGALTTTVQVFDPDGQTYRPLFATNPLTGASDVAATWQGFFAEVVSVPVGTNPALTYAVGATVATDAAFYGRGAQDAAAVHLVLNGTTVTGTVRDEAAWVCLTDRASVAWDTDDAGKLVPLTSDAPVALIAPVGTHGGEAVRQSVSALPVASATVPVAFMASQAGRFEVRWDEARIPFGWTASLRDLVTGAVVDLASVESYAFEATATAWTERFELSLSSATTAAEAEAPRVPTLSVPTPNPASGVSRLRPVAAQSGRVVATVVDALGRTVLTAFDGDLAAGASTEIVVDTEALAPGAYTVRIATATAMEARHLVVVR